MNISVVALVMKPASTNNGSEVLSTLPKTKATALPYPNVYTMHQSINQEKPPNINFLSLIHLFIFTLK